MVETFNDFLQTITDAKTKAVFEKLLILHISSRISENAKVYVQILDDVKFDELDNQIQDLCQDLRKEVYQLTKVLPCGNKYYGPLGNEDLQFYKRFIQNINQMKGATEKPSWWKFLYENSM